MADLDPRIRRVRRIGIGVVIALAVASVPIGVHIIQNRQSPGLWLALLGGVFMMVLICLYALETALSPIPKRQINTPVTIPPDETVIQNDTFIDKPPEGLSPTEMIEPEVCFHDPEGEDAEVVSLVEVEEVHTHPPYSTHPNPDLSEQDTELDPDRGHAQNPDGPVLTVPSSTLRSTGPNALENAHTDSDEKTET